MELKLEAQYHFEWLQMKGNILSKSNKTRIGFISWKLQKTDEENQRPKNEES